MNKDFSVIMDTEFAKISGELNDAGRKNTPDDSYKDLLRAVYIQAAFDGLKAMPEDYDGFKELAQEELQQPGLTDDQRQELQAELKQDSLSLCLKNRDSAIAFFEEHGMVWGKNLFDLDLTASDVQEIVNQMKNRFPLF